MQLSEQDRAALRKVKEQVRLVAQQTADFIREAREDFTMDEVESKGEHDFVSYVDRQSEERILSALGRILPEAGVMSEERGGEAQASGFCWIVDPLDGTTNFIHGMPPYAVSIGLTLDGEPILGVIHEVGLDESFHALVGDGAFLNYSPIHATSCASVEDALVATGFPYYDYSRLKPFLRTLEHFMVHSHGLRRLGSAATDLAYVACGRVDAFYEYGLRAWDVAAGIAIAREAGVQFSDFDRGDRILHGGEILCAGPGMFSEFQRVICDQMAQHG